VFTYAATSHYWRAMPAAWADWAWQRHRRSLIERAAKSVPAYNQLLRIFQPGPKHAPAAGELPPLRTCRRSYTEVFPLQQRCPRGWHRQALSFEPGTIDGEGWPRGQEEAGLLRDQLAHLLKSRFLVGRRRTLLVLALPETGWAGRRRIGQALQDALGTGQLRASIFDGQDNGYAEPASMRRLTAGFEQCVLLADPTRAITQGPWLAEYRGQRGWLSFGLLPASVGTDVRQEVAAWSVLGADEVGPLIAVETPLSRLVSSACRNKPSLRKHLLGNHPRPARMYQPFPRGPWIEQADEELLVSSWGTCPLLRYGLGWRGQMLPFAHVCEALQQNEVLPLRQMRQLTRIGSTCWKLPLLSLSKEPSRV
jgi:hypothetical protein